MGNCSVLLLREMTVCAVYFCIVGVYVNTYVLECVCECVMSEQLCVCVCASVTECIYVHG